MLINLYRDLGIITVSVGVGQSGAEYTPSKLLEIAGDESRVFEAENFTNLDGLTTDLQQLIQDAGKVNIHILR